MVSGLGRVAGRSVVIFAQESRVFCGTLSEMNCGKICKVLDLAMSQGMPIIGLWDGAGLRVEEGLDSLGGVGEILQRQVMASGSVPQISAVLGPCQGPCATMVSLADFVLLAEDLGRINAFQDGEFERADAQISGAGSAGPGGQLCHFLAADETAALAQLRILLGFLPSTYLDAPPEYRGEDDPLRCDDSLERLVPANPRKPYDIRRLLNRVVDNGSLLEVQAHLGRSLVVGLARLGDQAVGVVASQPAHLAGVLDIEAALKGARFVRFLDAFGLPLVTFVDVPGFLPGVAQELGGVIKHGAKLIYAYAQATVPKVTVIVRKAYGGAYAVMGSKHLRTDFNFAYPGAKIAVMGVEGAIDILYRKEIRSSGERAEAQRQRLIEEHGASFANPYRAAELGYVDAVISPRETRPRIIGALRQLRGKRRRTPEKKHGNLPL